MDKQQIKLLLVEDEQAFAWVLSDTLSGSGFEVRNAYDGEEALQLLHSELPDVIVADIMMPKMDGFTLVRQLRKEGIRTPVLFLSARTDPEDVVKGFELGASDYIRKPFAIKELIVRVRSLLGRLQETQAKIVEEKYQIGHLLFDAMAPKLSIQAAESVQEISLPTRESEILALLCRRMGEVVPTSTILQDLWGNDDYFCTRSLNVHITRLRKKVAADGRIAIDAFRGMGFRLWVRSE